MQEDGVIKFELVFSNAAAPADALTELNRWRGILWQHALIGQDPARYSGYAFGNVSQRCSPMDAPRGQRAFIISGTQTGRYPELDNNHYCTVTAYDARSSQVTAHGRVKPSSESLTHGMLYDLDSDIRAVLHVHSPDIWQAANRLGLPVTRADVTYGTPAMAREVARLFKSTTVRQQAIFSMGGHKDGIVAFGKTVTAAGDILLRALAASRAL
jgi:ribulose-5-phosphate 4-epimerase/fuculose-1-phosphate aldolase